MGKVVFEAQIAGLGEEATSFYGEKMVIFFGKEFASAVPELEQYCTLLYEPVLTDNILPGDTLYLDEMDYTVTSVGNVACENLKNLGHCVLVFDGAKEAQLPGNIHVEEKEIASLNAGFPVVVIRE